MTVGNRNIAILNRGHCDFENHSTGFLLADMSVEKLAELAEIGYIISLKTAERALKSQDGFHPQA